jgi:hypothetical protein
MNKDLQLLFNMTKGGDISASECVRINNALSTTNVNEIPEDQLANVKDYLITSLSMESVEPSIIKDLDKLLELLS